MSSNPHNSKYFSIVLEHQQFSSALAALARAQPEVARGALEEIAAEQTRNVARRLPSKFRSLANSVTPLISGPSRAPVLTIGSKRVEARIRHYGGTIKPFEARGLRPTDDAARRRVRGHWPIKYLTIPLTVLGVPKYARARDYSNLFVLKARSGKLFLAQRAVAASGGGKNTKKGFKKRNVRGYVNRTKLGTPNDKMQRGRKGELKQGFRLLFALKKEAVIKPHPYLYWSGHDQNLAAKIILRHLAAAAKP